MSKTLFWCGGKGHMPPSFQQSPQSGWSRKAGSPRKVRGQEAGETQNIMQLLCILESILLHCHGDLIHTTQKTEKDGIATIIFQIPVSQWLVFWLLQVVHAFVGANKLLNCLQDLCRLLFRHIRIKLLSKNYPSQHFACLNHGPAVKMMQMSKQKYQTLTEELYFLPIPKKLSSP